MLKKLLFREPILNLSIQNTHTHCFGIIVLMFQASHMVLQSLASSFLGEVLFFKGHRC